MLHESENNGNVIEFKYITKENMLEEVRQLFLEYANSLEFSLCFQDFETELIELPGKYSLPYGNLILALVNGKAAGCIALRKISDEICEMKRLYVRENYRGLGIGRALVNLIIEEAKQLNYAFIRLDTLPTMKEAQNLYRILGFREIEAYVNNPIEGTKYMELKLK
jgi:ribosomal protein S18 acetylase RimI-like enzyme